MANLKPLRSVLAWVWSGLVVAVGLAGVLIARFGSGDLSNQVWAAGFLLSSTLFTALGSLIFTRQPGNRIAWLFLLVGAGRVVDWAVVAQPSNVSQPDSLSVWVLLALIWAKTGWWLTLVIPLFLIPFLFPTGRFLTRRWSWAGWLAGFLATEAFITEAFAEEVGPPSGEWALNNPIGFIPVDGLEGAGAFSLAFGVGLISLMAGGVIAMVVRYRRSSQLARTQIKWIVYALVIFVMVLASRLFIEQWRDGAVAILVLLAALALIPVSITGAIIRYRLFEIDRIISRTLSYAAVVGALLAVYTAALALLTQMLPLQSDLAVAASTLAVAALFNPLRRSIQAWVDRRFNRTRYVAERELDLFTGRLKDITELAVVETDLFGLVHRTLQPSGIDLWIREPAG